MKKTLPFKTIKKKIALVDTRPDLYLILRFLCVPLDEAHVPLVVRVPHFENRCITWFNYFKSLLWVSPPMLGGSIFGRSLPGAGCHRMSFDSAVHGRLNARCPELFSLV